MQYRITNGAVSYGADTVLEEIDFEIRDKEKIAVVGRNGCGKSTLLNVITGGVELSEGIGDEKLNVLSSGNPKIGYLKQISFSDEKIRMIDEIKKVYAPILELEEKIKFSVENLSEDHSEKNLKAYADMLERFEFLGGYTYKKEYETAIKKFGFFDGDKIKPISEFSGGQRTKIAFIKLLLSKPDILLLDEPTNHLDVEAIEWLEEYLRSYKTSMVVVSHDRMFLDKIVNVVYEIEYGSLTRYSGNYTAFAAQKKANYEKQLKDHDAQRKEIARLTAIADRFRYKPTKASMAFSKLKQIEHMQIVDAPDRYDMKTFRADFSPEHESVKNALKVQELKIGYGEPLATVDFELERGQKLGVIGANGAGKSTLLKTLVRKISPLGGIFDFGVRVTVGYFDQQMAAAESEKTVFDDFYDEFPALSGTEVRSALGAFMFSGDDVFKKVSQLSGGEKVRLALCKILKRRPNFLILDEPTNHMDIVGKETLENMLAEYSGTLIFVSHDRYFVNKIADRLLVFENGNVEFFPCGYAKYAEEAAARKAENENSEENPAETKKIRKSFTTPLKEKERREKRIKKLEELIAASENETAYLKDELNKPEVFSDYIKINEIQSRLEELNKLSNGYLEELDELEI